MFTAPQQVSSKFTPFKAAPALALTILLGSAAAVIPLHPAQAQNQVQSPSPGGALALEITQFSQAVAEAASRDDALAKFYRENGFTPVWTGGDEAGRDRLAALLASFDKAEMHGLPEGRYDRRDVLAKLEGIRSDRDRGRAEVELSKLFLRFAADLRTGILDPRRVVPAIKRDSADIDGAALLAEFVSGPPSKFLKTLAPRSSEYNRLARERLRLKEVIAAGGWGPRVETGKLSPGDRGAGVIALRDRLIAMGYLRPTALSDYGSEMTEAVRRFQADHGLAEDGVAGEGTLGELNRSATERMGQILVAMERERWLGDERGQRHIWVNLTDFKARIIEDDEVVFETRSVIGKDVPDRETPEFSDTMEHMVINPSWYVPRSIVVGEYLPVLKRNPYALSYMEITDRNGRVVNRGRGFSQYNERNFPFSMRQPPSEKNALGLVKFMFPNKYNIYLHDTPAKSLFEREVRAFSHGCIRLNDPFEFAYALLSQQEADPQGFFQRQLRTGREARVNLETPLPVHLIYRTAVAKPEGGMEYRRDIYGRDAQILAALRREGVKLPDDLQS